MIDPVKPYHARRWTWARHMLRGSRYSVSATLIDLSEEERFDLANDQYLESLRRLDRALKGEDE